MKSSRTFVWSSNQDQDQDQEDTEAGQQEEDRETRRREPHHRQINRMRLLRENVRLWHLFIFISNSFYVYVNVPMIGDTLQLLFSCLRRSPCTVPRTTRHFPPSWPRRKPWWRSCCGSMASASGAWSVDRQQIWQLPFQYSHIFRTRATATFSLQARTCKSKVPQLFSFN